MLALPQRCHPLVGSSFSEESENDSMKPKSKPNMKPQVIKIIDGAKTLDVFFAALGRTMGHPGTLTREGFIEMARKAPKPSQEEVDQLRATLRNDAAQLSTKGRKENAK
jgi:hypothetical protein